MFLLIREASNDPNWCFFMPWWSRDHPRLILDRFGKTHFFMKIFIFLTEILTPTSTKTHMYIHNLVNLRVPRPRATQNAKTKWNLSNSTERMLRKTKNKIEKGSKLAARGKPSTWLPRGRLLSRHKVNHRPKIKRKITQSNASNKVTKKRSQLEDRIWQTYNFLLSFTRSRRVANVLFRVFYRSRNSQSIQINGFHVLELQGPSQIDSGSIWKSHFFIKIFIFLTEILSPTFMKTHMYIETLVNLSVPRPQVIQYAKLF